MKPSKFLLALTLAFGGVLSSVPAATANANASATTALNVRSGPGTGFNVLDTLYKGERVQTHQCNDGWCYITQSGPDGWVSARYLSTVGAPTISITYDTPRNSRHPRSIYPMLASSTNIWGGVSISWPFTAAPQNPRSLARPQESQHQACVYTGNHYTGLSTCINAGRSFEQLGPRWNNKISSVKVFNDASVTLCRNSYFDGHCRFVTRNVNSLGLLLNNKVSSLRVD